MSIASLDKIKQSVDKIAQKEYYSAIGKALGASEGVNKAGTAQSFRSLVLNKALHTLSLEDTRTFLREYNKDISEVDVAMLFNAYSNIASKKGYLVQNNTIYSIKSSSLAKAGISSYFNKFITGQAISTNGLALLNNELGDGFSALNTIIRSVSTSTNYSNSLNDFISAGIDLGHVHSNITYLANIATVSGFIDSTPAELTTIYKQASDPAIKEHIFNSYKEQLLSAKSSISIEIQEQIFEAIYDSQLELLREFSTKKEFKGLVSFKLTKAGSLAQITKAAIHRITQKAIVRVAPQNSEINQRLGRTVEAFYRPHLRLVYGAMLQVFKNKLEDIDILDLKGSKSMREIVVDSLTGIILKKPTTNTTILSSTSKNFTKKPSTLGSLSTRPSALKTKKVAKPPLRTLKGKFTSVTSLENLIRAALTNAIRKNMTEPALVNRTGRFAESVKLKYMSTDRAGNLNAYLTYMKYPYGTFEPGGSQGSIDRSPRLLIDRSVREIAVGLTTTRLKTIIV